MPVAALATALTVLGAGCGGTLEGKYRRGELTSTTTAPRPSPTSATTGPPANSTPGAPVASTSTTTAATSGNAARRAGPGEPKGDETGGTIVGSAVWRAVVQPLGGRHR